MKDTTNRPNRGQDIWYQDVIDLGFKVLPQNDSVFEEQYGYPYAIISKKLCKGFVADWNQHTHVVSVQHLNKELDILGTMATDNYDSLLILLEFFNKEKNADTIINVGEMENKTLEP